MASENPLPDSSLPVKVAEPDITAPPTLAEPASGPAADLLAAPTSAATDDKPASDAASKEVNGAIESEPKETAADAQTNPPTASEPVAASTTEAPAAATTEQSGQDKPSEREPSNKEASADAKGDAEARKGSNGKRKSTGGIPEHKGKKLNKKKSMPKITHLDAKPGDHFFARLKSYPPWPAIICDEEILPTTLLNTRPVTTKKADGSYGEAYADGGKKVNERTYPVMFLHTNEFAWIPNTDLGDLDPEQCKNVVEKGKSKPLIAAYGVAAEHHDLDYFKNMLMEHAKAMEEDEIQRQEAAEAKASKAKDKKKRKSEPKSKAADEDGDVEMDDADDATTSKKAKKRKKSEAASDDEDAEKPAKTPKTTKLKLTTNKTPATAEKKSKEKPAKGKSDKKRKSKAAADDEDEDMADAPEPEPEKPLDPAAAKQAREKEVLFLRHKLQKGFLSRDQAPQDEDMPQMAQYIKKLEDYENLEVSIIRTTKINKVLKAMIKLNTIPKDEEFSFRKRSVDLLGKWNKLLGAEPTEGDGPADEKETGKSTPATNGVHEENAEQKKEAKPEVAASTESAAPEAKNETSTTADASAESKPTEPETAASDEKPVEPSAPEQPKAEAPSAAASTEPVTLDKAPESAAAASEAHDVVKAAE